jgi:hypothetical protein
MSPRYVSEKEARELARYYRVLQIGTGAPAWAIKRQYRRLAKIWHPDRYVSDPIGQKEAEHKMKLIIEAYGRIRDAPLRPYPVPKGPPRKAAPAPLDLSSISWETGRRGRMPDAERFILGCLAVPAVLFLGLVMYILVAYYGTEAFGQIVSLVVGLSLPAMMFVVLLCVGFLTHTRFGDWLVKKLWG